MPEADSRYASLTTKNIQDDAGRPDYTAHGSTRSRAAAGNRIAASAAPGNVLTPPGSPNPQCRRAQPGGRI